MKLSLEQLEAVIANFVDEEKISNPTFTATKDNLVGLLDKVGKIFTLDTNYIDKLAMFEGEELRFGKTIEEWQQDLILPEDYDDTGAGALAPHFPTYRPVDYSYTLGRKKLPLSIKNDDVERAVNNEGEFNSIMAMQTKRLYDSVEAYRYQCKREILATLIAMCDDVKNASSTYSATASYLVGAYVKSGSPATYAVVVKPITASKPETSTFEKALAKGYIIALDLIKEVAVPVDSTTGEAFIKTVKKDVEVASDISEGHSLNGNTLGASNLVLLVKQGIMPSIQVDTLAGAFNKEEVALPAEVKVIKDFGSDNTDVFAILVDTRAIRLHNTYKAVRENLNGDGDWLNMFYHTEDTAHISRNTFVRIYRAQ